MVRLDQIDVRQNVLIQKLLLLCCVCMSPIILPVIIVDRRGKQIRVCWKKITTISMKSTTRSGVEQPRFSVVVNSQDRRTQQLRE